MKGIIESIIFVSGDEGVSLEKLKKITELTEKDLLIQLTILREDYNSINHGIYLDYLGDKYKFLTKKNCKPYLEKLVKIEKKDFLSSSALEVLAIIAYNNNITRMEIDKIRGVESSYQLKKLIYKNLVYNSGKSDLPGRPKVYKITEHCLDYLGLHSLDELPKLPNKISNEENVSDLYESKYKDIN